MAVGMGMSCMKYALFALNFLVFLFGGALVGVGAYATSMGRVGEIVSVPSISIGVIVAGCFLAVVGFFGCCGAGRESRTLLAMYFVVLLLLVLAQIALGVAAFAFGPKVETWVEQGWNNADPDARSWVETNLKCCGFKEPSENPTCVANSQATEGCFEVLVDFVDTRLQAVEITAIVLACVQVLALISSCCLFTSIPTAEEERRALLAESKRINNYQP